MMPQLKRHNRKLMMKNNRDVIQNLVDAFSTEPVCVADALSDGRFFFG